MELLEKYIIKQILYQPLISIEVPLNLKIIIVIPCYNEKHIKNTLTSLLKNVFSGISVEVMVVINSSIIDSEEVVIQNKKTYDEILDINKNSTPFLSIFPILLNQLPQKHAGVGLARKIGMDEAVRRFNCINQPDGIIVCLDADCTVASNYIHSINEHFKTNTKSPGCSIYFEHPLQGNECSKDEYEAIAKYELFLRYYNIGLRFTELPFAYQTVGSSMAVRCWAYAKQGGMNKRKAGEDFYFLHKIISLGNFTCLNNTCVYPSPRISNRVPFGTGVSVEKIIQNHQYKVYNIQSFIDLKKLVSAIPQLYTTNPEKIEIPKSIMQFLNTVNFIHELEIIRQNTQNINTFIKRFFQWFNAFMVLKYMHFCRDHFYLNTPILDASNNLWQALGKNSSFNKCVEALHSFRDLERTM